MGMHVQEKQDANARFNSRAKQEGWKSQSDRDFRFENTVLSELHALWTLKAKAGLPRRDEFDARSLKAVLSRLCIAEKVQDGNGHFWRWRLFGTKLASILGEYTGKRLEEVLPPDHVTRWQLIYDSCIDSLTPMRVVSDFQLSKIEHLSGETLVLPLADEKGEANLIFVVAFVGMKETTQQT